MQLSKLLLALVATLPFTVALPAAEADTAIENTHSLSERQTPYWIAQFFPTVTCDPAGTSSYNTWDQPSACTNILLLDMLTPKSFKFTSRGAWKLKLFNRMDCQGEVLVQGADTQPVCQKTVGIWPKRSFRVVRA